MMALSEELMQAAQAFGQALRATDVVQTYLDAQARLEADPEASSLEGRVSQLYQDLAARQRAGQLLTQAEVDEYYALRSQAQGHLLITTRDLVLGQLKGYLAEVALDLSNELGVDYTVLARPA
jgi:cell fate (sporulation/competence/biofilm development) regulator YlbF (YheA/YmcA/DUF963 family)